MILQVTFTSNALNVALGNTSIFLFVNFVPKPQYAQYCSNPQHIERSQSRGVSISSHY
jgi:hypothetical protein